MSRTIRGQAALEFLSTYGFAFLIILVMIGALSYFGVLSPTNLIPARCTFPADFSCFETQIVKDPAAGNATLNIVLINQMGNQLTFNSGNATSGQYGQGVCSFTPATLTGGDRTVMNCPMITGPGGVGAANFPAKGQKVKVTVSLMYTPLGRTYPVPVIGEVLNTLS